MDPSDNTKTHNESDSFPPHVEFVRVFEQFQRRGVATALLDFARQRWPTLELTPGVTEEGREFLEAYLARAEKEGAAGRKFVQRIRKQE